jgi:hypothetical protein
VRAPVARLATTGGSSIAALPRIAMTIRRIQWRASETIGRLAACGALAAGCGTHDVGSETAHQQSKPQTVDASDANVHDAAMATPMPDASAVEDATMPMLADAALEAAAPEDASVADEPPPATGGGPQSCGFTPCAPGAPCPDLVVDVDDLKSSILIDQRTFVATDCAIVEGCVITPGTRRLLHFDTGTANAGTADLSIGDPTENACFQWSQCHQHYHFKGVGSYVLYQSDGTTVAATGHKQGFCMEDTEPYGADPGPTPATPFNCNNQGLHVGWEDIYPNDIDCQWIDITGVPGGNYILSVTVDAEGFLPESNYDNNEARVPVVIPAP